MPNAAKTPIPAANPPANPGPIPPSPPSFDPVLDLLSRWPADQPLAILHSADPNRSATHARWSLIARPTVPLVSGSSAGQCPNFTDLLPQPREHTTPRAPRPIPDPFLLAPKGRTNGQTQGTPPFTSGHLGYLSYDAGRLLEPTAHHTGGRGGAKDDRRWPLSHWLRIDDALIYDHHLGQWWGLGDHQSILNSLSPCHLATVSPCRLTPLTSTTGRDGFLSQTRRILNYIRSGDVYQVNLAHRLTATFEGSPRDLFLSVSTSARPWYGAYLEFTDDQGRGRAIASASPELFLDFDPTTRRITTRPMKGTRPGSADPGELLDSPKDRAELNMITDLMRNDLGRICDFGTVRVESARDLEHHGIQRGTGLRPVSPSTNQALRDSHDPRAGGPCHILQTTSTITGRVRPSLTPADILAATFPGGSITGAPKIRAMQIIDELEPHRRGPYCGAIGFLGDDQRQTLSIAIRTALLTDQTLDYSVGAGIVADSDPDSEWEETLAKAAILLPSSPAGGGAAVLRGGGGSVSTSSSNSSSTPQPAP